MGRNPAAKPGLIATIIEVSSMLGAPFLLEKAYVIAERALTRGLLHGLSVPEAALAVVMVANWASDRQVPTGCIDAIAAKWSGSRLKRPRRFLHRVARRLARQLGMLPVRTESDYEYAVEYVVEKLGYPESVAATAKEIVRRAGHLRSGHRVWTIAAAAVYLAAMRHGLKVYASRVARAACTTDVSVRNLSRELSTLRHVVLDAGSQERRK